VSVSLVDRDDNAAHVNGLEGGASNAPGSSWRSARKPGRLYM